MALIYVVEDDKNIQEIETFALANVGYEVKGFDSATDFYAALNETAPDLILLDIMLPDEDGLSIVKKLRTRQDTVLVPVIMVTAKTTEIDKVKGLDLGADDYIIKPFRNRELISRMKNVLRRNGTDECCLQHGNVRLDTVAGKVYVDEKEVILTALEYRLLLNFFNYPNKLFTRDEILNQIWDMAGNFVNDNTLTVYIKRIREKIGDTDGILIETVRGIGYRLGGR